ncbi:MAG: UDP-3-O-(3-hydroxymyristoyl)glucosamine N-acyltransferase [Gammaproteobacteria bacterium]|nr:UDP-3-O-(3-hydroxymyristoyl)glucosamine N-acyltransferase [Gammaproteobacteria bacterium]MBT8109952.1 UDP-3-O-(3-hydroxymyristoyl)glucosamine N-acyltransferase [Gammaproteobacteria bacterium]NND47582.1 UDP-3-O-(3-hydroxymyristoyl)glucosamine N-acyltransferase [Woeseiaceae bacterium]NNL44654.1 UDP-3-O-(3-hydroxymyristoyl)glucosamine N-acyltransferase [Woeseiaceae bacterium]
MPISLGELATQFGCELIGDPDVLVSGVASLRNAGPESLSFLVGSTHKKQLSSTKAAAVILRPSDAGDSPVATILHDDPYACYARMAAVVCPPPTYRPGVHASAVVASSATVADSAHLAANVVVGESSVIGENVYLGPGTVIGPDCSIGDDCRLIANVTLARSVAIGVRGIFHPGVVIGSDGFGNAMTPDGWVKIPQLGGVRIGDDVEIGANTTVDCGALEDTIIEDGVRIDNLCMIGHNVYIGAHTAMAGTTAIAGSAVIGKRCLFAGRSGTVGHITVCDDVTVAAMTWLSKDVTTPGTYAASFPAVDAKSWSKQLARFRRLGKLIERVTKLEKGGKASSD